MICIIYFTTHKKFKIKKIKILKKKRRWFSRGSRVTYLIFSRTVDSKEITKNEESASTYSDRGTCRKGDFQPRREQLSNYLHLAPEESTVEIQQQVTELLP